MAENSQELSEKTKPPETAIDHSSTEVMNFAGVVDASVKSRPLSAHRARSESSEERENRLKMFKEKQNEERQKKLEEIKAQALAAQRFREMKEEERRRRIEELRTRDNDRRQQVEERKRLISEAERDRRESILKKNLEREARLELKKRHERGSLAMQFAFGSSTPRMLEPADTGGYGASTFWGHRRATSTTNIMSAPMTTASSTSTSTGPQPLTRRSSERELDGTKKRAISAGGDLERNTPSTTNDIRMSTSLYEVFHWDELSRPESSGSVTRSPYPQPSNLYITDGFGIGTSGNTANSNIGATLSALSTSRSFTSHLGETIAAGCASGHMGRRRTDLMPTIPIRDSSASSVSAQRKPFTKSPGRTYSLPRLDQLSKPRKRPSSTVDLPAVSENYQNKKLPNNKSGLKTTTASSMKTMSRSMGHLAISCRIPQPPTPKQPPVRPLRKSNSRSMHQLSIFTNNHQAPIPPPRTTRAVLLRRRAVESSSSSPEGPSRPDSSLSHQSTSSVSSTVNMRSRPVATPRKPRPISIAITGVTNGMNATSDINKNDARKLETTKPPLPRSRKTSIGKATPDRTTFKLSKTSPRTTPKPTPLQSPCTEVPNPPSSVVPITITSATQPTAPVAETAINNTTVEQPTTNTSTSECIEISKQQVSEEQGQMSSIENIEQQELDKPSINKSEQLTNNDDSALENAEMTASMIAKIRITTEEEAKAALAERRRLAREEAERQAEAERLRIEEEIRAESERQMKEEEQARILAEIQRLAEEERLAQAIKEAQKREEEEKQRREEELRQKLEKEEQERKLREETEKQRIEMQERLKQEEKEREARRKRVEAIMLRTRATKGNVANNQSKEENNPNEKFTNDENKSNQMMNKSTIESYEKVVSEKELALFNGSLCKNQSKENGENIEPHHSNGHRNGVTEDFSKVNNKSLIEHNAPHTLLMDLDDLDQFKNANMTTLEVTSEKMSHEDNMNSNTTDSHGTTTDLLL